MGQFILLLLFTAPLLGEVSLDKMMSYRQMQTTGLDKLNYSEKKALENWIDANFVARNGQGQGQGPGTGQGQAKDSQLSLSLNIGKGAILELSDGSSYEINPEDRLYTIYWITPFPIRISESGNPDYPVKITNMNTGRAVSGKQISTQELLEERHQPAPSPSPSPTPKPPLPQESKPQ